MFPVFFLSLAEDRNSHSFGMAWGCVNDGNLVSQTGVQEPKRIILGISVPVAQWLEHCVNSAKVVGSIPREHTY